LRNATVRQKSGNRQAAKSDFDAIFKKRVRSLYSETRSTGRGGSTEALKSVGDAARNVDDDSSSSRVRPLGAISEVKPNRRRN
jgi:hypothetical protein